MGPIILLDKSALQSLSDDEIGFLGKHYSPMMPPILLFEILGDLSKYKGEAIKFEIARKISSGDFKINANHRTICLASLLGEKIEMRGVPLISGGVQLKTEKGEKGIFFDEPPEWKLVRKWQQGKYTLVDRVISGVWRRISKEFDMEGYVREFKKANSDLPKSENFADMYKSIHSITMDAGSQDFYLNFLLNEFNVGLKYRIAILNRWQRRTSLMLCDFAPYAFYCLNVSLIFHFGLASNLITPKKTNPTDLEYLYYLPFCMSFVSGDKFQADLSKLLLKQDQDFVDRDALKADLRWIKEEWDGLDKAEREKRFYDYGAYPPQHNANSITYKLWKKHMKPWKPGSGNIKLSKEDEKRLMEQMRPMMDAIKKHEQQHTGQSAQKSSL
jgi:hypothetical protein